MSEEPEKFLTRWSRLKRQAKEQPAAEPLAAPAVDPKSQPPELPPVEKLTIDSDYRGFFHPKVDENLRRAALKRLFSDAHFNVMDGLDVYIGDYSKAEPIPAAMLAQLTQAQKIIDWAPEGRAAAEKSAKQSPGNIPRPAADQPVSVETSSLAPAADQRQGDGESVASHLTQRCDSKI